MPKNKCGHYIQSFSLRSFSTAQTIQSERGVGFFLVCFFVWKAQKRAMMNLLYRLALTKCHNCILIS